MSGFPEEFGEKVEIVEVDATAEDAAQVCQDLGFNNHGLVIRQGGEVLWSQPDHDVVVDDVRAKLNELVKVFSAEEPSRG